MKLHIIIASIFISMTAAAQTAEEKFQTESKQLHEQIAPLQKQAKEYKLANDTVSFNRIKPELFGLIKRSDSLENVFIRNNPDADLSLQLVFRKRNFVPVAALESYYNNFSERLRTSDQGKQLAAKIRANKATELNMPAIDFTLPSLNGEMASLKSFKGRYVLVDFWASWCVPCRKESPFLKAAFAKFQNRNFTILGISVDTKEDAWKAAVHQDGLTWTQLIETRGMKEGAAADYGVSAIPANFLIDPQGKIIAKNLRGAELEEKLKEILQ
ncbi:MAG: peroxiredoxin family protein [Pseudobacter sp.]|uniref:peroxiredoxin family protein n=1 Tax=Pseudobacter sp. TaxID=2045420 RepID=UPI003F7F9908